MGVETGPRGSDRGSLEKDLSLRQAPRQRPTGVQAPRQATHQQTRPDPPLPRPRRQRRVIAALLALRDHVIAPILAGVRSPRMGHKPKTWTAIDRDYENLRVGMQTLFRHVGIDTLTAAA